jgi:hypothetical protein
LYLQHLFEAFSSLCARPGRPVDSLGGNKIIAFLRAASGRRRNARRNVCFDQARQVKCIKSIPLCRAAGLMKRRRAKNVYYSGKKVNEYKKMADQQTDGHNLITHTQHTTNSHFLQLP